MKLNILLKRMSFLTICFCCIPYTFSMPLIISDVKPFAFLMAIVALILITTCKKKIIVDIFYVFSIPILLYLPFGLVFSEWDINAFRSIYGYLSFILISFTINTILSMQLFDKLNYVRILRFISVVWLFFGSIQFISKKLGLSTIIALGRTSEARGVTSLALEPSFYGIIVLFIAMLIFVLDEFKFRDLLILIISLLLAKSITSIFIAIFFLSPVVFYMLYKYHRRYQMLILSCFGLVTILALYFLMDLTSLMLYMPELFGARITLLFNKIMSDNSLLPVLMDGSGSARISNIYLSFKGSIDNLFLPRGFSGWETYFLSEIETLRHIFWNANLMQTGRIMSGYGSLVFETGIFGIFLLCGIYIIMFLRFSMKYIVCIVPCMTLIMINATPFALPTFALLWGTILWKSKLKTSNRSI